VWQNYLALDTSEQSCTLALSVAGQCYYDQRHLPRQHTQYIWSMIEGLLAQANITVQQIDALICGHGPGSFTGLRVACSVAQGIAVAINCPIIPVNTLAGLAYEAGSQDQLLVWPMMDARMGGVYSALYQVTTAAVTVVLPPAVHTYETVIQCTDQPFCAVGSGWLLPDVSALKLRAEQVIHTGPLSAQALLAYGLLSQKSAVSAGQFHPIYLRDQVTQ
jgi:tRNA threonylcarbamoyladenosine biosynthesis protein TsaB